MSGDAVSWITLGVGAVALVAALVWRRTVRSHRTADLVDGLRLGDRERRIEAGEDLVKGGLAPAARAVLPAMADERDPQVRAAVALAVARRQWEPGGSKPVLAIRAWAAEELDSQGYDVVVFGPAFARASDMGGPKREQPPAGAPVQSAPSATPPPVPAALVAQLPPPVPSALVAPVAHVEAVEPVEPAPGPPPVPAALVAQLPPPVPAALVPPGTPSAPSARPAPPTPSRSVPAAPPHEAGR